MTLLLADERRDSSLLRMVEEASSQNVYACYQCGKCMAACPFSLAPQRVVRLLQLGQIDEALAHATTWDCASCMTCATACPKGVSPARLHRTLRTLHLLAEHEGHAEDGRGNGHPPLDRAYRAHKKRLRTSLFCNIETLSRVGSALAPVSNWAMNVPGARLVADRLLGIHRERSLPPFVRGTFLEWFKTHVPRGQGQRGTVLLFHDTFMDFNYPQTGVAVTELLETAGFHVELADKVCCGRPMISKGLLSEAAVQARTNVTRLSEQARNGAYIVGCEPSCLLSLREEYPELAGTDLSDKARVVADRALLVDEFFAMLHARGQLDLAFRELRPEEREVVFHGHCHQKAAADPSKSIALLRLAGYDADMADAPCCGMAGAYGYEKEHYDASRAAGERALFPIVRARKNAQVAIMGVSCRQQIEHFTGRRPRHVVEFLREALAE